MGHFINVEMVIYALENQRVLMTTLVLPIQWQNLVVQCVLHAQLVNIVRKDQEHNKHALKVTIVMGYQQDLFNAQEVPMAHQKTKLNVPNVHLDISALNLVSQPQMEFVLLDIFVQEALGLSILMDLTQYKHQLEDNALSDPTAPWAPSHLKVARMVLTTIRLGK